MDYSVLMSVYIKEKANNLRESIDSMLNQTAPLSDFVIVCDGPLTEELDSLLDEYKDNYPDIFQIVRLPENKQLGNALRTGLPECRYNLVARMDSDDIACPDRMEKLLKLLEDESVAAAGGYIQEFHTDSQEEDFIRAVPLTHEEIVKMIGKRNPMNHVTVVFKKDRVLEVGSYIEINRFEDYWLWARLILAGYRLVNTDDICVRVRADGMFQRRKGKAFFKGALQFQKLMRQSGLISFPRYVLNIIIWFFATMVADKRIAQFVYQRCLRKTGQNGNN